MGFLGLRIASIFLDRQDTVYGISRKTERAREFEKIGFLPVFADLETGRGLEHLPKVDAAVFCAAPDSHDASAYRSLYIDGTSHFLQALSLKSPRARCLYTSSTSVWGSGSSGTINEEVPPTPENDKTHILLEAEKRVLEKKSNVVLRLAGLYGPGRNRLTGLFKDLPSRREANHYANLIHVDDAARASVLVLDKGKNCQIYIGCDNEPSLRRDIDGWLREKAGLAASVDILSGGAALGKKMSNRKIFSLGLSLSFPTYKDGYELILKNELPVLRGSR